MGNAVFDYTQDVLATLVSPRAAKRVLEEAVESANETPDTVPVSIMQTLLTGYIRFEFEQMLPREGLASRLERLAAQLPQQERSHSRQRDSSDSSDEVTEITEITEAAKREPSTDDLADEANNATNNATAEVAEVANVLTSAAGDETATITDLAEFTRTASQASKTPASSAKSSKGNLPAVMWKDQFAVTSKAAKLKGITMADSTKTKQTLSEAQLEAIVMRFAQVEHAKLIAAVRENGTIVTSRGAGVDLNSLSRFGLMGLRLLERSGELRSYYLAHSRGQLFLFCFGKDTVIMLGSSDINVGTVFATLSSVKESL